MKRRDGCTVRRRGGKSKMSLQELMDAQYTVYVEGKRMGTYPLADVVRKFG
jgi:hypothetical protein